MPREQIPLRLESALLGELNRVTRDLRMSRNEFITQAIERALDGKAGGYEAGYRAAYDRAFEFMHERSKLDRECLWDALEFVRDGMEIMPAIHKAFEENRKMRAYEAEVRAAQRRKNREQ